MPPRTGEHHLAVDQTRHATSAGRAWPCTRSRASINDRVVRELGGSRTIKYQLLGVSRRNNCYLEGVPRTNNCHLVRVWRTKKRHLAELLRPNKCHFVVVAFVWPRHPDEMTYIWHPDEHPGQANECESAAARPDKDTH